MRWVGGISYEMYLWHWPTYLVLTPQRLGLGGGALLAVRMSTVVVLAWATSRLVADPIRRGVRLRSPSLARITAGACVVVLGASVFAATVGGEPALSGRAGQVADQGAAPRARTPKALKVLVAGDSQGATLAQGVQAAPGVYGLSAQPGLNVWNRAILACPIVSFSVFVIDGNHVRNKCGGARFWQQQWARDVKAFRPDAAVVMAGAWDVFDAVMPDGSVARAGEPQFDQTYERNVGQLIDTLASTGAAVVVVAPPCYGEDQLVGTDPQIPQRLDHARLGAIDAVWRRASVAHHARVLDLNRVLCPRGVSNASIRPDGAHFSGSGADRVAPIVARAVQGAVAGLPTGANA
jgi:lysophospholipase L1-like esterase